MPTNGAAAGIRLSDTAYAAMIAHAYDGLPDEACGLLVGAPGELRADAWIPTFAPCRNAAESSRVYTVDAKDLLRIDRQAEDAGLQICGVMHSHTHTDAYPSPTDVTQAPDPDWHYIIVSLRDAEPMLRSYRIVDGGIAEEPVQVVRS